MVVEHPQRFIIVGLVFALLSILVAKTVWPMTTQAQSASASSPAPSATRIGTHLGYGDIATQVSIIKNVLTSDHGVTAGFPVTAMINPDTSPAELNDLANAAMSQHLFTIIRINNACTFSSYSSVISSIKTAFTANHGQSGQDYIIELGNEVNNPSECNTPSQYASNFGSISSDNKDILSPAALDFYNTQYPATQWISQYGASTFSGAAIRTANSYGCVGHKTSDCINNSDAINTYKQGYSGITQPLYLTEFSLSPEGGADDAPDKNLSDVAQFIQTYGPKTGAKDITPLIRDVCPNPDGQWLVYVNGKFFTKDNQPVDISSCGAQNTSAYVERNIQRDDQEAMLKHFTDEYSVTCLPKQSYSLVVQNADKCTYPYIGCKGWNATSELSVDVNGKLFGLFRNESAASSRNQSTSVLPPSNRLEGLEPYLTARDYSPTISNDGGSSYQDTSVNQAPLYKLTSPVQQCQVVYNKLQEVQNLCTHLIPSDTVNQKQCALDKQIGNTGITQTQLLSRIGSKDNCQNIMSSNDEQLKTAISQVNPALEIVYRPAFIVFTTVVDGTQGNPKFESQGTTDSQNKFIQVDYLEVKVPDFGSDRSSSEQGDYQDPLQLTADLLTTKTQQDTFNQKVADARTAVRNNVKPSYEEGEFPVYSQGNLPMKCWQNNTLVDCSQDAVASALLRFINASSAIMDPGHDWIRQGNQSWTLPCQANAKDFFSSDKVSQVGSNPSETATQLGSQLQAVDVGTLKKKTSATIKIQEHVDLDQPIGSGIGTTQMFFITPHNYNLLYAQQAFLSSLTLDQQKQILQGDFPQVLQMDLNQTYTGASQQRDNTNQVPLNSQYSAAVSVSVNQNQSDQHSLLWQVAASIANLPTRLYTLLTTARNTPPNDFTLSCAHNTEAWFTGQCSGSVGIQPGPTCQAGSMLTGCENFAPGNACVQCDLRIASCTPGLLHPAGTGQSAFISDAAIGLALKVSQYTCTPAEMIVGVMAKESSGVVASEDTPQLPIIGDPLQQVFGGYPDCKNLDPNQSAACGAFQYFQGEVPNQIKKYNGQIQPCLDALGVSSNSDARTLGVSMCIAGAQLWRGLDCTRHPYVCLLENNFSCNGKGEVPLSSFSDTEIRNATAIFHGADNANENYWQFIQNYKAEVQQVRGNLQSCQQNQ